MCLTSKDKRVIISPLSMSTQQRKNARYRVRTKIQNMLQDMQFLNENYSKMRDELGMDMTTYDEVITGVASAQSHHGSNAEKKYPEKVMKEEERQKEVSDYGKTMTEDDRLEEEITQKDDGSNAIAVSAAADPDLF